MFSCFKKTVSLLLAVAMLSSLCLTLFSCSFSENYSTVSADDLMKNITPQVTEKSNDLSDAGLIMTDFSLKLFKNSSAHKSNTLLSPLSIITALAMTANGASGKTLEEMEALFGMSVEDANVYLYTLLDSLPSDEKYKFSLANSIWLTDHKRFTPNQTFLQKNANYYGADIYRAPFDNTTLKDINNWVKNKTDGMIDSVLDRIPQSAVMYLINAIAFDAQWQEIYEKSSVVKGAFTDINGKKLEVEYMHSDESKYIEYGSSIGFIKPYAKNKYAFVALLPNENIGLEEYIAGIDPDELRQSILLSSNQTVSAAIPKFEYEYTAELAELLKNLGMKTAFNETDADFTNLGTSEGGNIFINRILHKTYIKVAEKGTKAAAVTVVEMTDGCAAPLTKKEVHLTRPFVYMIVDTENYIPLFIGTVTSPK